MEKNDVNLNDNNIGKNNSSFQFADLTEITDRLIELIGKNIIDYSSKSCLYLIFSIGQINKSYK